MARITILLNRIRSWSRISWQTVPIVWNPGKSHTIGTVRHGFWYRLLLLRHREPFDEEGSSPCGSLAERCYFLVHGGFEPAPSQLEGGKHNNCRSRGRSLHSFEGNNRCPEGDQPPPKRCERGFKLFVIQLKPCWIMNLDQSDKIGRRCAGGLEWVHLIDCPFEGEHFFGGPAPPLGDAMINRTSLYS